MARYVEAERAHHDLNPEVEHARAEKHIDALGLHPATKQHIIDNGMADVVGHLHANTSERMAIAALATSDKQIPALQKIRKKIVGGGGATSETEDDNEATDEYIASRKKRAGLRR
jgi:hypothetical protein